jgi:hypothetical protein
LTLSYARKLSEISEQADGDPKKAILKAVGDVSGIEVFHNLVLVATYVAPPKMMKGPDGQKIKFYTTDRDKAEERFQGKVGLVLKVGPIAFHDDNVNKFGGIAVKPGDWVMYRASDGNELFIVDDNKIDGSSCRLLEDVHIKARLVDPSLVY